MAPAFFHDWVSGTGRASALLFALALLLPLAPSAFRLARLVFTAFMLVHAVHFAVLALFARQYPQAALFPGARTLSEVGGWPAASGIVVLFFTLAVLAFPAARNAPEQTSLARDVSTTLIALMFLATYQPLLSRSFWFALPPLLIFAGLVTSLVRPRLRTWRCFA
jgi:hypothetical protein